MTIISVVLSIFSSPSKPKTAKRRPEFPSIENIKRAIRNLTETRYSDKAREFTLAQTLNCSVDLSQRERL
jgi:hypothetical protein